MAYYCATHSTRFCGVVAVNGRADWEYQALKGDAFLVAQMGGTPDSLPDRYRRSSPLRNVERAAAPLLAVTGMKDTQIYPTNGRTIVSALQSVGKKAELIEFAHEGHLIADPANRARLWNTIFSFVATSCSVGAASPR